MYGICIIVSSRYVEACGGGTYGFPSGPMTMPFGKGAAAGVDVCVSSGCSTGPGILLYLSRYKRACCVEPEF